MMRSRTLFMVTAAALALGGCAWGQMRGNAQRSGVNYFAPGITLGSLGKLAPAWTTPDRGATATEVTTKDGRVFFAGSSALWAVDLATGDDLWHVDRTNGHQTNDLLPTTAWTDNGVPVVGMNQFWSDSISGTPWFQWLAQLDLLDPATGSVLGTRTTAAQTPPLDDGDWLYSPVNHIVARPISLGGSILDLHLDARALDGSGATFNIPLNSPVDPISSLAVNNANLYLRTLAGLKVYPAHGCGQTNCGPVWQATLPNSSPAGLIAVARDRLFDVGQSGTVSAINANGCGALACGPVWQGSVGFTPAGIAVTTDRVYITAGPTLSVFDADGCGASTCTPLWTSTVTGTPTAPTIVNDVVFAGSTNGDLLAWNVDGCGAATCSPAWSQAQGAPVGPVSPLANGVVFPVGGSVRKLSLP